MSHYHAQQEELARNRRQAKSLRSQLAELEEKIEEGVKPRVAWGEMYYFLDSFFTVSSDCEEGHRFDKQRREAGNYFASITEAEVFRDWLWENMPKGLS